MGGITDIEGITVGHVTDLKHGTGCTVVLCEDGGVCGADIRGGATGTFGADTAGVLHLVPKTHAIVLTGGSAFGLESVFGVMQWLEERNIGFDVGVTKVPIVSGSVVFDLRLGSETVRPTKQWGYRACDAANSDTVDEGNTGAGTGATVGKLMGMKTAMKGGLGSATVQLKNDILVGAIAIVNAAGDVWDWESNHLIAGVRDPKTGKFSDTTKLMKEGVIRRNFKDAPTHNTTIGVVATNAKLEKWQATKVAQLAQNGIAWAVRPAHTMFDGDTIFAISTGDIEGDVNTLGLAAQEAMATAIRNAIFQAESLHGVPSAGEHHATHN